MTRIRAFTYCCISFAIAVVLMYAIVNLSFGWGKVVRGAQVVADERDFWSAIEAKVPCERNGWKFCPHTDKKEVLVVKRGKRK